MVNNPPKSVLESLLIKYSDQNWQWFHVSYNPNLTMDFVIDHPNLPWDISGLVSNPNFTPKYFEILSPILDIDLDDLPICHSLLTNPNMYKYFINKSIINIDISTQTLCYSQNPELDITTILKYKKESQVGNNSKLLSLYAKIKIKDIDNNLDFYWDWDYLSYNKNLNISIDFIIKHIDKKWNWYQLSQHSRIKLNDISDHWDLNWDINGLSCHPYLIPDFLEKYANKSWNWDTIASHPNFNIDYLVEKLGTDLNYYNLSQNPNLTLHDFLKYRYLKWDYYSLLHHPNFEIKKMLDIIDSIDWISISSHPNITIDIIDKYKTEIYFNTLSYNEFGYNLNNKPLLYSDNRKELSLMKMNLLKEELIKKTWSPNRILDWCLAEVDKWWVYRSLDNP